MSTLEIHEINDCIETFKTEPWIYDNNVNECYSACKRIVCKMQEEKIIDGSCETYDRYIEYISEKLGI